MALLPVIDLSNEGNQSPRYGAAVRWWVFHTEEGNSSARRLHEWMKRNGVSYHYVSDPKEVLAIVDTDNASWSVLDANPNCINWVFAGSRSSWTRAQWMQRADEIETAARVFREDADKYDPLLAVVIGKNYVAIGQGKSGAIDHSGITYGLGIGTHTDNGNNFPFDYFQDLLGHELNPVPPVPPRNAIDEIAEQSPWLGDRITVGENVCPDGIGRWAQFTNGYVYWSPATGARPVPNHIFETWAVHGWEAGDLGYPVAYHDTLPVGSASPVGDVQAFQKGVIYRKYGQDGYWVHGEIGDAWKRSGFENGPMGWPTSNEFFGSVPGQIIQQFEGGYMAWQPEGVVMLAPADGPDYTVTPGH